MGATKCSFGGTEIAGPVTTTVKTVATRVTALSDGGTRYVYKAKGASLDQWTLTFSGLGAADKSSLQGFYDGTAEGPTNVFDYTHTDRVLISGVRFIDTELNWTRDNAESWGVTVTLEVSGRV